MYYYLYCELIYNILFFFLFNELFVVFVYVCVCIILELLYSVLICAYYLLYYAHILLPHSAIIVLIINPGTI